MRFLTFNMQAAIATQSYSQYLTHSHRQLFDAKPKRRVLSEIAKLIAGYDVVCLQEVDLGGRRAGFVSQVEFLMERSGLAHCAVQENRTIGKISRHGNATLSRFPIEDVQDIKLPGRHGRGSIVSKIQPGARAIHVVNLHLSLRREGQNLQLDYLASALRQAPDLLVAGDFNCACQSGQILEFARKTGCAVHTRSQHLSYPAWKPRRGLDHILSTSTIAVTECKTVPAILSDHLPIEARLVVGSAG